MIDDALIDDLVADIIDQSGQHMKVAQDAITRLTTEYPALTERYGDWALGLSIGSIPARKVIVAALHEKGMSNRQIAAKLSVSEPTVRRDLAASNDAPVEPEPASNDAPVEPDEAEPEPVILPPVPAYKGQPAPAVPFPDPRPEVVDVVKSIRQRMLTLNERQMLNKALTP